MDNVPIGTTSLVDEARRLPCPVCPAPAGRACTADGEDHLARWTGARNDRRISAAGFAAVIVSLNVITNWSRVTPPCRTCGEFWAADPDGDCACTREQVTS